MRFLPASLGVADHLHCGPRCWRALAAWIVAALCLGLPAAASAQVGMRTIPSDAYFQMFGVYYEGDYNSAARGFRDSGRGALASVEGQWVDSICYYTMIGECHYQMGDLAGALNQYTAACNLSTLR